jgi:hypothetical protein
LVSLESSERGVAWVDRLLIGDARWVSRLFHLLAGAAAMGQAEGLAARIKGHDRRLRTGGGGGDIL